MDVRSEVELPDESSFRDMFEGFEVAESVLDAIKQGQWDYEPESIESDYFDSTQALPGTDEKLSILAGRVNEGLPLWHPEDRKTYDDNDEI